MSREFEMQSKAQKPWGTYSLVLINTCFLLAATTFSASSTERLVEMGALHPLLVWKGEIWRLATAMFVHGSFVHYALNTFILLHVGRTLEPILGASQILFLYFICGVSGFCSSLLVTGEISLGASGAVFGLIGAMISCMVASPKLKVEPKVLRTLIFFVGLNLAFGVAVNVLLPHVTKIDNAAHLAGLIFGLCFGFGFAAEKSTYSSYATSSLGMGLLGFACLLGAAVKPVFSSHYHEQMAFDALMAKDFESSLGHVKWLEESSPNAFQAKILYARIAANQGDKNRALKLAREALQESQKSPESFLMASIFEGQTRLDFADALFSDDQGNAIFCNVAIESGAQQAEVFNNCAWLLLTSRAEGVHDPKRGLQLALQAVHANDKAPAAILHTLAEGFYQNGQLAEAIQAIDRALIQSSSRAHSEILETKRSLESELASVLHKKSQPQALK